jgi:glycosyltransferase involved in cell wall biosynthesis
MRGLLFGAAVSRKLKKLIQDGHVDLVNFHGQFVAEMAMPITRRHRIPCVFTMHNPLWSDTAACESPWDRMRFRLEWRAEARAEYVIGLSESVTDNRVRYFGLCRSKTVVVPVGVDDLWFERKPVGALVRDKYAPDDEAVLLHVGRIAPYKNQLTLVKALARVLASASHTRAVFVGPVDSQPYLRKLWDVAAEMGVARNIVIAGHVPFDELAELYSLASIVVLPSLRENCPQAALEAMAQGKAIVASDIGPLREVLPNGTCIRVSTLDHEALAAAIALLLDDDKLREDIGARARARAHCTYRWDAVCKRIVSAYARMVECSIRRSPVA